MAHVLLDSRGRVIPEKTDGPTIEMATVENVAARKFLQFALDDIKFQLTKMSQDRAVSKETFEESKDGALLISTYLAGLVHELDQVIASAIAKPTEALQ